MIDFYTWGTPNGRKVSIALEELALPCEMHRFKLKTNVQKAGGLVMEGLPQLARWHAQIGARPAVLRGMQVPPPAAST